MRTAARTRASPATRRTWQTSEPRDPVPDRWRRPMAKRGTGTKAAAGVIVDTVADVVVDAKGAVTPVSGKVARQLHKIEKKLKAARKTEARRLRQLSSAESSKKRGHVKKRTHQAAKAATEVAALAARLTDAAADAAGSAANAVGGAVGGATGAVADAGKSVGAAALRAATVLTPVQARPAESVDGATTSPRPAARRAPG